jgi:hypothetical protein
MENKVSKTHCTDSPKFILEKLVAHYGFETLGIN